MMAGDHGSCSDAGAQAGADLLANQQHGVYSDARSTREATACHTRRPFISEGGIGYALDTCHTVLISLPENRSYHDRCDLRTARVLGSRARHTSYTVAYDASAKEYRIARTLWSARPMMLVCHCFGVGLSSAEVQR